MPETVTVLPVPMALVANVPVPAHVTRPTSALATPASEQFVVAAGVASYVLLFAVTDGVTVAAVILAVVAAVGVARGWFPPCAPDSAMPLTVTVLRVPTLLRAKVPVPAHFAWPTSPLATPASEQVVVAA